MLSHNIGSTGTQTVKISKMIEQTTLNSVRKILPEESFNASWQTMWLSMVGKKTDAKGKSPSCGTVSDGRNRLPMEVINKVFMWVCQQAQRLSSQYDKWRGHRVVLVDGTCLSMPNEPGLQSEFGVPNGYRGKGRNPIAKMVTLCLCNTMTVLAYKVGRYASDENTLLYPFA
jgi:hypothetical protein